MIFRLAFRNVFRQRRRSLLTLLSMGGGYLLLCLSLSLSEGSYNHIIDVFTRDHTGHVQIHAEDYLLRPSVYKRIKSYDEVMERIKTEFDIDSIAPRLYSPALAYGENKTSPASVVGIDSILEANTSLLAQKIQQGSYFPEKVQVDEEGYYPAMMGYSLAQSLSLQVGEEIVLISQGVDGSIANDVFRIVAIVGTEDSHERMSVYLPMIVMREFLAMDEGVHELALTLSQLDDAENIAQKIQQLLRDQYPQQELYAQPWQVVEQSFYNGMQADKQGNYVTMGIIMFIVSIGVLNTVLMSTLERTREFGVLKAIGTRPSILFRMIVLEASLLSIFGCVLGLVLALPVNGYFVLHGVVLDQGFDMGGILFDRLLGEFSWVTLGIPGLVVVGSTLLVSVIPALRAARISPVTALHSV